ncbi:diguanylate cyclase [Virgibacillus flavescens]|uniref:sensor domain-containing diguanylate cyclase n=1 Tax=Virgibacillus flavescens TaxID=1611422 RepID=UPI003D325B7A
MEYRLDYAPCGYITLTNQGTIQAANQTFLRMLDYSLDDMVGQHIEHTMSNANKFLFHSYLYPALQSNGFVNELYLTLTTKANEKVPVLLNARQFTENGKEIIDCIIVPMKKRIDYENEIRTIHNKLEIAYKQKNETLAKLEVLNKENEEKQQQLSELNLELDKLASLDSLTQLKNRRIFLDTLDEQVQLFNNHAISFSLLIIDIDYFKKVNDTWGHLVGDQILINLSHIMENVGRKNDILARYGGEEFVILLPETEEKTAISYAETLRSNVEQAKWGEFSITISIGVSTFNVNDTQHTILAKADFALYDSKNKGRNRTTHSSSLNNQLFENN